MNVFASQFSQDVSYRRRAILLSAFVGVALLIIKFLAAIVTRSAAILSDAPESIINVIASGFRLTLPCYWYPKQSHVTETAVQE